jgi:hypothetical protein
LRSPSETSKGHGGGFDAVPQRDHLEPVLPMGEPLKS